MAAAGAEKGPASRPAQPAQPEPEAVDPVVQAMRTTGSSGAISTTCLTLRSALLPAETEAEHKEKANASRKVEKALGKADPRMRMAYADSFLYGLYGLPTDRDRAARMYSKIKSPEAGWNAALLLYQSADISANPELAKQVLHLLKRSTALDDKARGPSSGPASFLAGLILDHGWAGEIDRGEAYRRYRHATNQRYVPAVAYYLTMTIEALPLLKPAEQAHFVHIVRTVARRWRWRSPAAMAILGNLYADGWIESDDKNYYAAYYWRMARLMAEEGDFGELPISGTSPALSEKDEKRLAESVQKDMRNVSLDSPEFDFTTECH